MNLISEAEWRSRQQAHKDALWPAANERLERTARGEKHPARDFLFEYYSHRPAHLLRWSPGTDSLLVGATPADIEWKEFRPHPDGMMLESAAFPERRRGFVTWALAYLEGIARRPPLFGCFGLHEWAMVHRSDDVRHSRTPLRLSPTAIADTVESADVCCTHYDAFRFFTPSAVPLNRHALTRESTDRFDQRGCVHVTMDLYRYAYKLGAFVPGEIIAETFALASKARELDMRASPYDLAAYGLVPIAIETREGKEQYVMAQRALADEALGPRERLITAYRIVADSFWSIDARAKEPRTESAAETRVASPGRDRPRTE